MAYSPPRYSRSRVDRAGHALATQSATSEDHAVINDWRTSHALPLNVVYMRAKRLGGALDPKALYSQRIKRLPSIETKFRRNPKMQLTRMQDLGGCRVVLSGVGHIERLRRRYQASKTKTHGQVREYDYLATPKDDGYRGVHLVFKYKGTRPSAYDGQFIELQIRSRLQHGWAMAVETVDHLLNQDLKVGGGDRDWKRFFALMGTAHALSEGTPIVTDTPDDTKRLANEIKGLSTILRVKAQLRGFQTAQKAIDHKALQGMDYFLLELRAKEQTTVVHGYGQREIEAARARYLEVEAEGNVDVVLVRVQGVNALRQAYPSYFLDTTQFLNSLDHIVKQA